MPCPSANVGECTRPAKCRGAAALLALATLLPAATPQAQVVLDGTLGPPGALPGPDFAITADLGEQVGGNLFHSFQSFDIEAGQSATFSGPASVTDIIGRVTGADASQIDGALRTSIPGAALYLLNPNGVFFGPSARLETSGSLHVSSAQFLRLGEDGIFPTVPAILPILSASAPTAFGFLGPVAAEIAVDRATLSVPAGSTLAVVAGNVSLDDAALSAPSGRLEVVSVASAGEVFNTPDGPDVSALDTLGTIAINRSTDAVGPVLNGIPIANLDVSGPGAGEIFLRGGQIVVRGAQVFADTLGSENGGGLDVIAREGLALSEGARMTADTLGDGRAGNVNVKVGGRLMLSGLSTVIASNALAGSGDGGTVTVQADTVEVDNRAAFEVSTIAGSTGNAGSLSISARIVTVSGAGAISSISRGSGDGGTISIDAAELVQVENLGGDQQRSAIEGNAFNTGRVGNINIRSPLLVVAAGGTVQAQSLVLADNEAASKIDLNVGVLELRDGAFVTTTTQGAAPAGDINIRADEAVRVSGSAAQGPSRISSDSVSTVQGGKGGRISIAAPTIVVEQGAEISVNSSDIRGNAGSISIDTVTMRIDQAKVSAESSFTGGGQIIISASNLLDIVDSQVRTIVDRPTMDDTVSDDAGDISILRPRFVILDNSALSANAIVGRGGNLLIATDQLIANPQSILEATSEFGVFGTIVIDSPANNIEPNQVLLDTEFLDISSLLREACNAGNTNQVSTFAVTGRGGLPVTPGHYGAGTDTESSNHGADRGNPAQTLALHPRQMSGNPCATFSADHPSLTF